MIFGAFSAPPGEKRAGSSLISDWTVAGKPSAKVMYHFSGDQNTSLIHPVLDKAENFREHALAPPPLYFSDKLFCMANFNTRASTHKSHAMIVGCSRGDVSACYMIPG